MSRMKIAVLGGAGFIGANLTRWLLKAFPGARIDIYDNLWTGLMKHVPEHNDVLFFHADVSDPSLPWEQRNYDVVFHLASPASPVWYTPKPLETIRANVCGAELATKLVRDGGIIMYTSTSEVYGDPLVSPQPESYRGSVSTTGPRAAYDESKRCAEALLTGWHREVGKSRGIKLKIARIFNCFGQYTRPDDGRAVSNFLNWGIEGKTLKVHGPGTQTRCFGHVNEILKGLMHLTFDTHPDFIGPLNIGLDDEISVIQLAEFICENLFHGGVKWEIVAPTPDDPQQRKPDLTMCRRMIPMWKPTFSWQEGVALTLEWFQQTRD